MPLNRVPPGPWISYTPTITAGVGTITTASATGRYQIIGKTCHYNIAVTITTNGTGSSSVIATLPFTSASFQQQCGAGRGAAVFFGMIMAFIPVNTNTVLMARSDGTYPGANGASWAISGTYETA